MQRRLKIGDRLRGRVKKSVCCLPIISTMARWLSFLAQVAAFASLAWAKSSTGDSVLVVLEKDLQREQFSTFFSGLEGALFAVAVVVDDALTTFMKNEDTNSLSESQRRRVLSFSTQVFLNSRTSFFSRQQQNVRPSMPFTSNRPLTFTTSIRGGHIPAIACLSPRGKCQHHLHPLADADNSLLSGVRVLSHPPTAAHTPSLPLPPSRHPTHNATYLYSLERSLLDTGHAAHPLLRHPARAQHEPTARAIRPRSA